MKINKILVLMVLIISIVSLTSTVNAAVHPIEGISSSEIQAIIDYDVNEGDTLNFTGNFTSISLISDISLNFIGNNQTVIDNSGDSSLTAFTFVGAANVNITGFNITGGNHSITFVNVTGGTIQDNKFMGQVSNGINIDNSNCLKVIGNDFTNSGNDGVSIYRNAHDVNFTFNNFVNMPWGIYFGGGVYNVIVGYNYFYAAGTAVDINRTADRIKVLYNHIDGGNVANSIGISLKEGDTRHDPLNPTKVNQVEIIGNTIKNNNIGILFYNVTSWGNITCNYNGFYNNNQDIAIEITSIMLKAVWMRLIDTNIFG